MTQERDEPSKRFYLSIPDDWDSMTEAEKKAAALEMALVMQRELGTGKADGTRPNDPVLDDGS